jgi:hypothetical protein
MYWSYCQAAYRIEGGTPPPGMFIMPFESGDLTKRTRISMMARTGNSKTKPSGSEMVEFPFNRMRRRKKASLGEAFSACLERSSNLSRLSFDDGSLLVRSCMKPMVVF